ncbi:hypothetical protein P20480_1489 [Pseudoalteromonas sp. BSi20480]|nr:hypothetical protein P20480_1489 [Pseudoalteromonas sp. BSi20480]
MCQYLLATHINYNKELALITSYLPPNTNCKLHTLQPNICQNNPLFK